MTWVDPHADETRAKQISSIVFSRKIFLWENQYPAATQGAFRIQAHPAPARSNEIAFFPHEAPRFRSMFRQLCLDAKYFFRRINILQHYKGLAVLTLALSFTLP